MGINCAKTPVNGTKIRINVAITRVIAVITPLLLHYGRFNPAFVALSVAHSPIQFAENNKLHAETCKLYAEISKLYAENSLQEKLILSN